MTQKQCRTCSESKPLSEFYAHASTADSLNTQCKSCYRVAKRDRARAKVAKLHGGLPPLESAVLKELATGPKTARMIAFETDYMDKGVEDTLARLRRTGRVVSEGEQWRLVEEVAA